MVRKRRKRFQVVERYEREGLDEVQKRVRIQMRVIDERGIIVSGAPSKTVTLFDVKLSDVWTAVQSVLDQ